MNYILTLIGNPNSPLDASLTAAIEQAAQPLGPAVWLRDGLVCEWPIDAGSAQSVLADVRDLVSGRPIDSAVQPNVKRRKKLLLADMDSTIIQQECIDEIGDMLGLKGPIAAITERAMRGEIEFEPALRERVALLEGLEVTALDEVYAKRITHMPGGRTLTATMRANGALTALISGGFSFFTERVAAAVGFDRNQANRLLIENGKLTGKVAEPILGREAKLGALIALRSELGATKEETLAVGDGANDLGMIHEAGLGVAYHAKPIVAEAASARIDHNDLTALLYLQGYRYDEFVSA